MTTMTARLVVSQDENFQFGVDNYLHVAAGADEMREG